MKKLMLLFILQGCISADRAGLVASTAGIVCDATQTYQGANEGWRYHVETNPLIKDKSSNVVATYFVTALILNSLVWYGLPDGYKSLYGGVTAGVEFKAAVNSGHKYVCFGR